MVDDLLDYFGTDIVFRKHDDGYHATVKVMDSEGLYYWLLQYGSNVKVISPDSVKEKLLGKVKGVLKMYEED